LKPGRSNTVCNDFQFDPDSDPDPRKFSKAAAWGRKPMAMNPIASGKICRGAVKR